MPSSVPSNPPPETKPSPVVASPASVQFTAVSSPGVPVTFSMPGSPGGFTLHGDCTGIINTSGASPTWTLTPVGVGRCVIVGLGDRGASAVVHIGVVTPLETPRPVASPTVPPPTHLAGRPDDGAPTTHPTTDRRRTRRTEPDRADDAPTTDPTAAHPPRDSDPTPKPSVTPSPTPTPGSTPQN